VSPFWNMHPIALAFSGSDGRDLLLRSVPWIPLARSELARLNR
jgi:hypothetical protein